MLDYKEAKAGVAEEIRGALRALGVERIVVKPLDQVSKIEGGVDVTPSSPGRRYPSTMGTSLGSAISMVNMVITFATIIAAR